MSSFFVDNRKTQNGRQPHRWVDPLGRMEMFGNSGLLRRSTSLVVADAEAPIVSGKSFVKTHADIASLCVASQSKTRPYPTPARWPPNFVIGQ